MPAWKYAFSLSLEEVKNATPPGTVQLIGHQETENGHVVDEVRKLPQPSPDPADPLNWTLLRKSMVLATASLYAFVANFTSSCIAPALQLWSITFSNDHRSFAQLTYLIAVHVLFLGTANIWWVPLANVFGRRPVMILATLVMTLASIWCAMASSYNSLIAARIFQAIGGAAADTVAPALLGDIYFVDERGRALAVYTIFLCTGPLVGGIAGGYIGFDLGWDYIFWICTGLSGACFVASMLFVPETLYSRIAPTDSNGQSDNISVKETTAARLENADPESYPSYTIARTLALHRPRGKLLPQFLRPWLTLKFPAVWVVMLHYAGLVGGVAAISVVGIQLVASPPYLWGANAGLLQIGALIGSLLALLYTYISSDSGLKRRAKHETNGLAEAEDRLPAMFPCLAIATAGFLVFGFCGQHPSQHGWVGLEVGFGMLAFGLMQIPSIGFTYIIDSYETLAADCFVIVAILRSIISFAWTFFVAEWVEKKGAAEAFGIFGLLMGIFALLTVPLWKYGKRIRIATAALV